MLDIFRFLLQRLRCFFFFFFSFFFLLLYLNFFQVRSPFVDSFGFQCFLQLLLQKVMSKSQNDPKKKQQQMSTKTIHKVKEKQYFILYTAKDNLFTIYP